MTATTPPLHLLIVEGNHVKALSADQLMAGHMVQQRRYAETLSALAPN